MSKIRLYIGKNVDAYLSGKLLVPYKLFDSMAECDEYIKNNKNKTPYMKIKEDNVDILNKIFKIM